MTIKGKKDNTRRGQPISTSCQACWLGSRSTIFKPVWVPLQTLT
jgi:hypothetical protein